MPGKPPSMLGKVKGCAAPYAESMWPVDADGEWSAWKRCGWFRQNIWPGKGWMREFRWNGTILVEREYADSLPNSQAVNRMVRRMEEGREQRRADAAERKAIADEMADAVREATEGQGQPDEWRQGKAAGDIEVPAGDYAGLFLSAAHERAWCGMPWRGGASIKTSADAEDYAAWVKGEPSLHQPVDGELVVVAGDVARCPLPSDDTALSCWLCKGNAGGCVDRCNEDDLPLPLRVACPIRGLDVA